MVSLDEQVRSFRIFKFHHVGPRTDEDARDASSIYIRTAFLNSSQNHGPYPNTGIICFCLCYIDHVFSRFYFSLCDGNTRVCTRFSLFTPYRTCIKGMQAILPQLQHGLLSCVGWGWVSQHAVNSTGCLWYVGPWAVSSISPCLLLMTSSDMIGTYSNRLKRIETDENRMKAGGIMRGGGGLSWVDRVWDRG